MQFRVGVMALATVLIAGILIVLFGKLPNFANGDYTLEVRFTEAPGVSVNSPVRKSGILVGRVSKIEFDHDGKVLVTLTINGDIKIRRNETIRINSSLLGDAELQVVPTKEPPPLPAAQQSQVIRAMDLQIVPVQAKKEGDEFYKPGEVVDGQVANNPLNVLSNLEGTVSRTVTSLGDASEEIRRLANTVNERIEINKDKFDSIIANADKTFININRTLDGLRDVLGDDKLKADLRKSFEEIPQLITATKEALASVQSAMAGVDRNVKNLEGLTEPLGKRGDQIVSNVDSSVARLNELVGQIERFSRKINSDEGTIGQLLNNPELYQQLNEAAANINDVSKRLRPIVEDARIITDRISRHPGIILRDAVKPGPGTKWSTPE